MPPCISYKDQVKTNYTNMCKIKFMKHKKLSSMYYLTVNISSLDGDSLANGKIGCTTCSETTSIVAVSVNGADGNGCRGGWHTGGVDGWVAMDPHRLYV
jgi:hypothetical protein